VKVAATYLVSGSLLHNHLDEVLQHLATPLVTTEQDGGAKVAEEMRARRLHGVENRVLEEKVDHVRAALVEIENDG
jgi:hypothetical protein